MAAGVGPVGVKWGQMGSKHAKTGCTPCGCSLDKFEVLGQVGQESNLQPAVLETAALPIELPTYGDADIVARRFASPLDATAAYTNSEHSVKPLQSLLPPFLASPQQEIVAQASSEIELGAVTAASSARGPLPLGLGERRLPVMWYTCSCTVL
jgi:hypothetical protein